MNKNPYARLREATGLSQRQFAEKHGLGKMTLVYLEAGVWPKVSERMTELIEAECAEKDIDIPTLLKQEYGTKSLNAAYVTWIVEERREMQEQMGRYEPDQWTPKESPFASLVRRSVGSADGWAKAMKVNQTTVRKYMRGTVRSMPRQVMESFTDIDWPYTRQLLERQAAWTDEHVV
jgi:transcriptional regulator with XRE-family HTH domain